MAQPDAIKINPELQKVYDNYNFLLNLLTHAKARALSDKSNKFIENYQIPVILKKTGR